MVLIPSLTKLQPINARAKTAATAAPLRSAFSWRRCLIPADRFYEWKEVDSKTKQPMYTRRKDGHPFAFAGLWERWKPDPDAEPVDTFAIITTTPNAVMKSIHDRMPVILEAAHYEEWLSRDVPGDDVIALLKLAPADAMEAYPVSKIVNSPRTDSPACIERIAGHDPDAGEQQPPPPNSA